MLQGTDFVKQALLQAGNNYDEPWRMHIHKKCYVNAMSHEIWSPIKSSPPKPKFCHQNWSPHINDWLLQSWSYVVTTCKLYNTAIVVDDK